MNRQSLSIPALATNSEQPTTAYDSLRARLMAYIVVFVIATCYAVVSDLFFGVPAKTVTTGIIILTIVLLLLSPLGHQMIQRAQPGRRLEKAYLNYLKELQNGFDAMKIETIWETGEVPQITRKEWAERVFRCLAAGRVEEIERAELGLVTEFWIPLSVVETQRLTPYFEALRDKGFLELIQVESKETDDTWYFNVLSPLPFGVIHAQVIHNDATSVETVHKVKSMR